MLSNTKTRSNARKLELPSFETEKHEEQITEEIQVSDQQKFETEKKVLLSEGQALIGIKRLEI